MQQEKRAIVVGRPATRVLVPSATKLAADSAEFGKLRESGRASPAFANIKKGLSGLR